MSISVGGYHSGFTHSGAMGLSSAQDVYYPAPYPAYVPVSSEYATFGDRSAYIHNWMHSSSPDVPMSSPEPYGPMCSTPSPVNSMCQGHVGYPTESGPSLKQQWEEYHMSPADHGHFNPLMRPLGDLSQYDTYTNSFGERCYRRRTSANKKERRRTLSINNAFSNLRGSIPNVPSDTKLSKIKTLRLAISYISYLNEVLEKDDPTLVETGFKADISRKRERRTLVNVKKPADSCDSDDSSGSSANSNTSGPDSKPKGRTGWPQHVWASELKTNQQ